MAGTIQRIAATLLALAAPACTGIGACAGPAPLDDAAMEALYAASNRLPDGPLSVFHLGHSLVGRDMPAMLAQLAGAGHEHASQLGWGASLKAHWGDAEIHGFAQENAHPRFRDAGQAVDSGDYDAIVLTEMVEIRDAIRHHASPDYLARWAGRAWRANPEAEVYLYETWHNIDDPEGWLARIDRDSATYWEGEILRRALAADGMERPIRVIPAGPVFARFVREAAARGGVDGVARPEDLFARTEDGGQDTIHVNDLGAYLAALTHYAVLYRRSPVGLPAELLRADGTDAVAPGPEAARLMQEVVWEVVSAHPRTGVDADRPERLTESE